MMSEFGGEAVQQEERDVGRSPLGNVKPEARVEMRWPEPTEQQKAWLEDLAWVESRAASLKTVESMTVAAVAYVSGDIVNFKSRCAFVDSNCGCVNLTRGSRDAAARANGAAEAVARRSCKSGQSGGFTADGGEHDCGGCGVRV
jgi:hypothetical protein